MAQGALLPLALKNGRLKKLSGDGYINQLIMTALVGMDSDNPFQTLGLGEWMIFGINDLMSAGEIREHVVAIFESFKADQLAKINNPETDIIITSSGKDGEEMQMDLSYVNMETQERQEISVPIPSGA